MAEIKVMYYEEVMRNDDSEITIDSKWKWIPTYEEAKEITDNWTCSRDLLAGFTSKIKFAEWYLKEIKNIDDELIDFIDKIDVANYLLEKHYDCIQELSTGAIIQYELGLAAD